MKPEILTVGHSTHPIDRFLSLLRDHGVEAIADVRRYPASRRHPHFGADALAASLRSQGIEYEPFREQLGGRRRTVFMCAESRPSRCHRRLFADALLARGWRVVHLLPDGREEEHALNPDAVIDAGRVHYPAQPSLDL